MKFHGALRPVGEFAAIIADPSGLHPAWYSLTIIKMVNISLVRP
jgi:hypothetical protein